MESDDPTPLSSVIGLRATRHKPGHVRNWFDGLLPDNVAVREEWGRRFQVSARNPLALLRHVGRDAAGAVQVVPEGQEADDAIARTGDVEWLADDDLESLLAGLSRGRGDWGRELQNGRWSLAGAQNKAALHHDGHRWGIPLDSTPTTHILKAAIGGYDLHDINEYACQRAARELGLPAATTTLLEKGEERAVVSQRYDRVVIDGAWRRLHQEDLCQALGVSPAMKYQSDGGPGLAQFLTVFAQFQPLAQQQAARRTFFDYLCFNVIIGASDAHAKNFSVLRAGSASRLAPLYDVASVLPYLSERIASSGLRTEGPRSALRIGSTYDLPAIGEDDIASCARSLGLPPGEGVERYRDLAARAPGAFEQVAASLGVEDHARFVRELSGKVAAHVAGRWRHGVLF
ncbi:type II toxin-antitoxin system HipA family toxin [Aeromicrobium halocynthiae]|uniref:Type II toxin-antitoxin system HipA family toxin n=1 Tax=Aeromicrobium halocynthiae TaxID=560557 RepID=A0ABN2VW51_9ACTN